MGQRADLDAAVGRSTEETLESTPDANELQVAHSETLLAFADAAVKGEALAELRQQLVDAVGAAGAGQAAATVAAFSGLVRVADGTGIPIDDGLASTSVDVREDLKLNSFAGAANSTLDTVTATAFNDVDSLWGQPARQ